MRGSPCLLIALLLLGCGDAPAHTVSVRGDEDAGRGSHIAAADGGRDSSTCHADAARSPTGSQCIARGDGQDGSVQQDVVDSSTACTDCNTQSAVLPEPVPAELSHAARIDPECVDVAGTAGFYTQPSLYAFHDKLYVFSVDSSEASPRVLMQVAPLDTLAFTAPTPLVYGARKVELVSDDGVLHALAARQYYAVELESTDGQTFEQLQQVGPKEPTYNCEGFPPLRYFRGQSPAKLLAMGADYNSGVFGCYERVFVGRRGNDGTWLEPVEVGRGNVIFAYQGKTLASILTSLGFLQSRDDATTFSTVNGLEATGGAATATQIVLVRGGGSAGPGLFALASEDEAATWSKQLRLLSETPASSPLIAADGENISIAAETGTELVLLTSLDDTATWTKPSRIARGSSRLIALAQHGRTTAWLTAGADNALQVCVLD